MGTKYNSQSATGYNSSPPPDDGSTTASNVVEWSKHITKIGDPLKTLADNINSTLSTHFDEGPNPHTASYTTALTDYNSVLEVEGTSLTITLLAPATAASGYRVTIKVTSASDTVTIQSGSGNIDGSASIALAPGTAVTVMVNDAADEYMVVSESLQAASTQVSPGIVATEKLAIERTSTTQVTIDFDAIVLQDAGGNKRVFGGVTAKVANITNGVGANGLDVGTEASGTWYNIYAIATPGGAVDSILSTSTTGPVLPSGYTFFGLIGAVYNNSGSDFDAMHQIDSRVVTPEQAYYNGDPGTSFVSQTVATLVPTTARALKGNISAYNDVGVNGHAAAAVASNSSGWGVARASGESAVNGNIQLGGEAQVYLIESQTVYVVANAAGDNLSATVTGWEY